MKKYFLVILILLNSAYIFSQKTGIVYSNNVRVRNQPTTNATIISTRQKNNLVTIYEVSGSGLMLNGVWDYWFKISEKDNLWINAYWVFTIPFTFVSTAIDEGGEYKYYTDVEDIVDDKVSVLSVYMLWGDIQKRKLLISDFDYSESESRGAFLVTNILQSPNLQKICITENRSINDKKTEEYFKINGVIIQNNLYYDINNPVLRMIQIENNSTTIYFGIKNGMSVWELKSIIGKPTKQENDQLVYEVGKNGFGERITFDVNNGIIVKINYYLEN